MKVSATLAGAIALLALMLAPRHASAQPYSLDWYTIDGGGVSFTAAGPYELGATIAQPDASNESAPAAYRLAGGFWIAPGACPADFNADGQVDDFDFVIFAQEYDIFVCTPLMPYGCIADLDGSGIVDDIDFVLFAQAYDLFLCP